MKLILSYFFLGFISLSLLGNSSNSGSLKLIKGTSSPIVTSYFPIDNATGIDDFSFTLTFDKNVFRGPHGGFLMKKASDNSTVSSISIINTRRIHINDNVVQIDFERQDPGENYYIIIPEGTLVDNAKNKFAGISSSVEWNFTSDTAPYLIEASPENNSSEFSSSDFTLTFNENIIKASNRNKFISILDFYSQEVIYQLNVLNNKVKVTDNKVSFRIDSPLPLNKKYFITVSPEAFIDTNGYYFNGVEESSILNFKTDQAPFLTYTALNSGNEFTSAKSIALVFNEPVTKGYGTIYIKSNIDDAVLFETGVRSNLITIQENRVRIRNSVNLPLDQEFYITIPSTAFRDLNNNFFAGVNDKTILNFSKSLGLEVTSTSPQNNTEIGLGDSLKVTFNKFIRPGSGFVQVMDASNDQEIFKYDITDAKILFEQNQIIIPFPGDTPLNKNLYVKTNEIAIRDINAKPFDGFNNKTDWAFSTPEDLKVVSRTPEIGATGVYNFTFTMTFNRNVYRGENGGFLIKRKSDDRIVSSISYQNKNKLNITNNVVTLTFEKLEPGTDYYIIVSERALLDEQGNGLSGISTPEDWTFTSDLAPYIVETSPANHSINFTGQNLSLTLSENITKDEATYGEITVSDFYTGEVYEQISTLSNKVQVDQAVIQIELTNTLPLNREYFVSISSEAFIDNHGYYFEGIADSEIWRFKTDKLPLLSSATLKGATSSQSGNLVELIFDEIVERGYGTISINAASNDDKIFSAGVNNDLVSVNGNKVSISVQEGLPLDGQFYMLIPSTAFRDENDHYFAGILNKNTLSFDNSIPLSIAETYPENNSLIYIGDSLTITFNKFISVGKGKIKVFDSEDDNEIFEYDITDPQLVFDQKKLIIPFKGHIPLNKSLYVTIDNTAIEGINDLTFVGINNSSDWAFSTPGALHIVNKTPENGTSSVDNFLFSMTFDRNVFKGENGAFIIRDAITGNNVTGRSVDRKEVTIDGATVNVQFSSLTINKSYYMYIRPGTLIDIEGNLFEGIDSPTIWTFNTDELPSSGESNHSSIEDIKEAEENGIHIYPNPSTTNLFVNIPKLGTTPAIVKLISSQGVIVYEGSIDSNVSEIPIQNLKKGVYLVKIQGDNFTFSGKALITQEENPH